MGVDGPEGGVFAAVVVEDPRQNRVFKHVGMVACMKPVAITEQDRLRRVKTKCELLRDAVRLARMADGTLKRVFTRVFERFHV